MKLEELRKSGKDGVYDAVRDEYFIKGEEPPAPARVTAAPVKPQVGKVDTVTASSAVKPADEAKTDMAPKKGLDVKTTDTGKK